MALAENQTVSENNNDIETKVKISGLDFVVSLRFMILSWI
jgi:hypothetical protein